MQDSMSLLDPLLERAARRLSIHYDMYWPKHDGADPNERDLTMALASAIYEAHPDWGTFTEVPLHQGSQEKLDLLVIAPERGFCWLIESKNIESSKMRHQVADDLRKLQRFEAKPTLQGGRPFPQNSVRVTLMMGWTSGEHAEGPFQKPVYQRLREAVTRQYPNLQIGHFEIPRHGLVEPYRHQWLIYFAG